MACPDCAGDDKKRETCKTCHRYGVQVFTQCPFKLLDDDTRILLELMENAKAGTWPVAGGLLDQCCSFVEAYRTYRNHSARYEVPRWPM